MCAPPSIYTHPFVWYIRVRILSYCHCQWEEGGGFFPLSLFPYFCLSILTIILSWISRSVTEFVVRATSSATLRSVNFLNQCLFLRILVLNIWNLLCCSHEKFWWDRISLLVCRLWYASQYMYFDFIRGMFFYVNFCIAVPVFSFYRSA